MLSPKMPVMLVATLLLACGGASRSQQIDEAAMATLPDLDALDSAARSGAVVETIHGRPVADPYRALENDDELTRAWIDAETAATTRYLDEHADPRRAERLGELLSIGFFDQVALAGDCAFFLERDAEQDQPVMKVIDDVGGPADALQARVLLDPNAMAEDLAIDWLYPSPGCRYVAYGLSASGSEESTLHILDVQTGDTLSEVIEHTKWTNLAWLNDETGFYYTRFPAPGDPDFDPEHVHAYFQHLFFHRLGDDPADDPLVRRAARTEFLWPQLSEDDRYLTVTIWRSWSETDLVLYDRSRPSAEPIAVAMGGDYVIYGSVHRDRLVMKSNQDHPRGRVLDAPVQTAADRSTWRELVPERDAAIESMQVAGDHIVLAYVEDVASSLRLFDLDGTFVDEIELPVRGTVSNIATDTARDRIVFAFSSFFYPPTLFRYDPETRDLSTVARVQADVDPSGYELSQVTVTSADGTRVNLYLVHRQGLQRDGTNPVLLNGYGGFGSSQMPVFQRNVLYWLERGGVFAVANIRGGGEFGERWHRDGMLENKVHSFEDFEAAIRWLSDSGVSSPDRIAIIGGSNGGLLMGAMLTRCPGAFRAAVSSVGLYDMVRFPQFPPAEIWMSEYGNPEEPDAFAYLLDYSPYHNVREGVAYPAALITTADHDTRVSWQHSTKFAAALQGATSSDRPILFYMNRGMGHGAGTGRSDLIDEYVRYYTFIETELGLD